ncbi:MAG TPA: hypothetical protein VLS89_14860 [Candidatus Nanopelagicales bacterium]|nr:hypothetical protein [Candidatus Nanopelagicales bacterium]
MAASLLVEIRQLRAAVPDDADLQAAERAAQECAARLDAYAARLPPPEPAAPKDGDGGAGEPSPEGYNVPPYPN